MRPETKRRRNSRKEKETKRIKHTHALCFNLVPVPMRRKLFRGHAANGEIAEVKSPSLVLVEVGEDLGKHR